MFFDMLFGLFPLLNFMVPNVYAISSDATVFGRQRTNCLAALEMKTGFGLHNYVWVYLSSKTGKNMISVK